MGQRLWKNGEKGLEEWYEPEDFLSVFFENIISKIFIWIIVIAIALIVGIFK